MAIIIRTLCWALIFIIQFNVVNDAEKTFGNNIELGERESKKLNMILRFYGGRGSFNQSCPRLHHSS